MWRLVYIFLFLFVPGIIVIVHSSAVLNAGERVRTPVIPKALKPVEKGHAELMRRHHMDLMIHKRDKTVHDGIRTKKHSLKECIACHVVFGEDNKPVSYQNPKHFCRTCHDYAAVSVDCFQCHASKPPSIVRREANAMSDLSVRLQEYLRNEKRK